MTESPYRIIRLIALANGDPSPIDGHYVVDYDPSRDGVDTDGNPIGCYLVTTVDPAQARQYSTTEALELWRKVDSRNPRRPDGKPNRPLTSYTVEIGPPPPGVAPTPPTFDTTIPAGTPAGQEDTNA